MSTPASLALRNELIAASELLRPQLKGLDDFLLLHLTDDTHVSVQREQNDHNRRLALIRDVLTALDSLEDDNYPDMPIAELGAAAFKELQDQHAAITAALAEFEAIPVAERLTISLGSPTPRPE